MNQTFFSTLHLKVEGKLSKQGKSFTVSIFFLMHNPRCIMVSLSRTIWIFQGNYLRCLCVSIVILGVKSIFCEKGSFVFIFLFVRTTLGPWKSFRVSQKFSFKYYARIIKFCFLSSPSSFLPSGAFASPLPPYSYRGKTSFQIKT